MEQVTTARRWASLHVFWRGDLSPVLVEAVAPVEQELRASGAADGFFFIRYGEGGKHLRLRFATAERVGHAALVERATDLLRRRLDGLPRPEDGGGVGPPCGTIVEQAYQPEVDRFGGMFTIGVAERCFEASSRAALELLTLIGSSKRSQLQGLAFAMQLTAAHAAFPVRTAATAYLRGLVEYGFLQYFGADHRQREDAALVLVFMQRSFAEQRDALIGLASRLWRRCEEGLMADEAGEEGILARWHAAIATTAGELRRQLDRGRLAPRFGSVGGGPLQHPAALGPLLGPLFDLAHLTHNRLGVVHHDEIFVGYALTESMATAEERR